MQDELQTRINEAGLDDNVKLLGFVPDQHLAALYRAANISVVPTVALEGLWPDYGGIAGLGHAGAGDAGGRLAGSGGGFVAESGVAGDGRRRRSRMGLRARSNGTLKLPDAEACRAYARDNFDNSVIAKRVARVYGEAIAEGGVH